MAVAGSLTYKTDLDKNGFEKGINSIKASTVAAGNIMADAIKDVIGKVVELGKSAVNSYADLEQNVGGVETLFKKSSDKVIKNAEKAYKTAGISANNYMSTVTSFSASLLQSLAGDTEKAADVADMALTDMADNANKFGTSMESIQNAYQGFAKQNYTMLDNLKLGYGGTKEEMERLLEDAQKITGIKYDISNLNDVFQAIHVIQQELDITGTTAKEAEETISGSVSSMKAAWDNFLNGSGTFDQFVDSAKIAFENIAKAVAELLPRIAKEIAGAVPQEFVDAVKKVIPYLEGIGIIVLSWKIGKTVQGAVQAFQKARVTLSLFTAQANGATIAQGLFNGALTLGETLVGLLTGKVTLAQIATAGLTKAQAALKAVMSANPIMLIVLAIGALVAAFVVLWNKCEWFRNFWIGLWDGIKNIVSSTVESIKKFFGNLINNIKKAFSGISSWFSKTFNEIKNAITNVFSTVAQWFSENVIEPIKEFFQPLVSWFTELFTSIFNCLASIVEVVIVLIQGCIQTIQIIWGMVVDWFNTNIIQPVAQFFTDLWNMISTAAQKAWQGIVDVWNVVTQWFEDTIITPISDFFDTMWNKLKDGASNAWQGIKNVFSNITNWFRDKFSEAWNAVKNVFSAGGKIFDGIKDGILNGLKTVINGLISGINRVIKVPFDGINSALNTVRNFGIGDAKPFSGLPSISTPQIPQLARGIGLAKKGHQYLLEGQGNEAVVPLDKNKYWTRAVATEMIKAINEQKSVSNSNTILKSSAESRTILIDNRVEGVVELEGQKTGRLLAPHVMKTVKVGG